MLSEALRKNASTKTGGDGGATLLKFDGVDGMRVCNASAPFLFQGKQHLFATVLSGDGSAQVAGVRLFVKTSHASYEVVPNHATYQLTRPFVARIHGELVFAGLKVIYDKSQPCERYCDIYRGTPDRVHYYSSGENNYQAFCAVPLASPAKAFAIFGHTRNGTNPRTITCTTCTDLNDISAASFKAARPIGDADFQQVPGEVRQAFLLEDSMVGCLATHICPTKGATVVTTFVYNPTTNGVEDVCVLPTPDVPPPTKAESVKDELFLSGMVYREDGMCDVFLGLNYSTEVCITVNYPFAKHGKIASPLTF